jgi:zeta-carotene desaturase
VKDLRSPAGLDNLLYSADTYFSCFADLALTSPVEYFKAGEGSLMQCVITPAAPYMPWTNEAIAAETDKQVWGVTGRKWRIVCVWGGDKAADNNKRLNNSVFAPTTQLLLRFADI